jgi:hypothetical protein
MQPAHFPVIKDIFPQSKIEEIPGTDHWLYYQEPDKFSSLVESFLEDKTSK